MGKIPKFQAIEVQNPMKVPFSNKDLMWTNGVQHGAQNKMSTKIAHVPYVCVSIFLESEHKDMDTFVGWPMHKNVPPQMNIKHLTIKTHLGHAW
jgi:hypothetical protein